MGARPEILCKLTKGITLSAHSGFVDTWNWIVDFCENLCGDAEIDSTDGAARVDRNDSSHPVIRIEKDNIQGGGGGGGSISIVGTDGSSGTVGTGTPSGTLTFAKASDSNITATVSESNGNVIVTLGIYYK